MTIDDFREIALGLNGAVESSHMGQPDFRVGGRIFATLASRHLGYGNLMLSPELQNKLISQAPSVFLPVHGGWGRMGATHIVLAEADETQLVEALHTAWKYRVEKNNASRTKRAGTKKTSTKKKA